jgi:predicted Zn-dependent peptidase
MALESSEGRADALSKFATYLGDPRRALDYTEKLRGVTADRMDRFAAQYLRRQDQVTLLYVPQDSSALGAA